MAHRHKVHRKHGGKVFYAGGESHVAHEAEEHKHGGRTKHHKTEHGHKHHRIDKKARGGGVGSDKHPFSSAHMGHKHGGHVSGHHRPHHLKGG